MQPIATISETQQIAVGFASYLNNLKAALLPPSIERFASIKNF